MRRGLKFGWLNKESNLIWNSWSVLCVKRVPPCRCLPTSPTSVLRSKVLQEDCRLCIESAPLGDVHVAGKMPSKIESQSIRSNRGFSATLERTSLFTTPAGCCWLGFRPPFPLYDDAIEWCFVFQPVVVLTLFYVFFLHSRLTQTLLEDRKI